jgi:hypothetical protein
VIGVGVFLGGRARAAVTPRFDRHSGVSTGALKKSAGFTEIVPEAGDFWLFVKPVSVPSSSLSSVCLSISV